MNEEIWRDGYADAHAGETFAMDEVLQPIAGRMSIRISADGYIILEAGGISPENATKLIGKTMELASYDRTDRLLTIDATGGALPPKKGTGQQKQAGDGTSKKPKKTVK